MKELTEENKQILADKINLNLKIITVLHKAKFLEIEDLESIQDFLNNDEDWAVVAVGITPKNERSD